MTPIYEFLRSWERACERKGFPKLLAELVVSEPAQTQAARRGREFLLACALGPWEADDVMSEIALLTVTDDGDETWRLRRLSGSQAAQAAGGHLTAYFAKSFILATWVRPVAPARPKRPRSVAAGTA